MIDRYALPEMTSLWSEQNKFRTWLKVEMAALGAMAQLELVPADAVSDLVSRAENVEIRVDRIDEIEKETRHDVIAFLTHMAEQLGKNARYLHMGMTSSDLIDTATAVRLVRATQLLREKLDRVVDVLRSKSEEYKYQLAIGRSHGIHAEPTTIGLKFLGFYAEFKRASARLNQALAEISTCAISGAVGTYSQLPPEVEELIAQTLGLEVEPVSTQVIPRDRYAAYFAHLGVIASSIERLAVEIRHLQRTEVLEAREVFAKGQKGSSAMPHKRNPILSENLTGLARLVRSAVIPAMENVALWHERDISHSSVERAILPDSTTHLHFALHRLAGLIEGLVFIDENIERNLWVTGGLWASQSVLLELARAGISREHAYKMVQRNAMRSWDEGADFKTLLLADEEIIGRIDVASIEACFEADRYTRHVDHIFVRVLDEA